DMPRRMTELQHTIPAVTLATFFLFAFAMKAAACPVNFWLPPSYHTPRIATAALFGGVLTKIGVYALLRTFGMLMPDQLTLLSTDRKSTRLNSSHVKISYAVFCLKKKK